MGAHIDSVSKHHYIVYFVGVFMLQHKPKPKLVDVWLEVKIASCSISLDLSCSQLSYPFNNVTQKHVLTYFFKNVAKK
jgi:hypothetical protein